VAVPSHRFCRAIAAVAVLLAATGAGVAGAAADPRLGQPRPAVPIQDPDDGLAVSATTTHTIDPVGRAVHVVVDLSATNQIADQRTPQGIRYFYFDAVAVPVLREAANLRASVGGTALSVRVETVGDSPVAVAVIDLATSLRFGRTQTIQLAYDLPDQPPRTSAWTRVNEAYAFVAPLPVGDAGAASVRIVVPPEFDVEEFGSSPFRVEEVDGQFHYVADAIADPLAYDGGLIARNVDALVRTEVDGEYDIDLRAWPGDTQWSEFVSTEVSEGLPVLERLIGQPWPMPRTLLIDESVNPYVYGYSGWFDSLASTIEIGDQLDAQVVFHELAHAWFSQRLFRDRWINEGLAEEFATRTLAELGEPLPEPDPVDPADPGLVALNSWYTPPLASDISYDRERYGYNTSFFLFRSLSGEIGVEGLAAVIAAEADDLIAYQGDPEAEAWVPDGDWRRLLDLLEEVGGSDTAAELFATHVVAPAEADLLSARADARAALDGLATAGEGWSAPFAVRRQMSLWQFDQAAAAMERSHAVLDTRDELAQVLQPVGIEVPAALEQHYETASDLEALGAEASALLDAGRDLVAAEEAVDGGHDVFTRIGLLGSGVDGDLDEARTRFADGDASGTREASAGVIDGVDAAAGAGQVRSAGAVGLAMAAMAIGGVVRRRRRSGPDPDAEDGVGDDQAWRGPETNATPLGESR
jgi:hypothetical protein